MDPEADDNAPAGPYICPVDDAVIAPTGSLPETLPAMRRVRRIALVVILTAAGLSIGGHPRPAFTGPGLGVEIDEDVLRAYARD